MKAGSGKHVLVLATALVSLTGLMPPVLIR